MSQIDLSKVRALREARIRFWLFSRKLPHQDPDPDLNGAPIIEGGVVLLSATFQAFVEDLFVEASKKRFERDFKEDGLKRYKKTWERWGNPSVANINRLFRRLGIDDVFEDMSKQAAAAVHFSVNDFKESADRLNKIRNKIAHGQRLTLDGLDFHLNLSVLDRWTRHIEEGSKRLSFCVLRQAGL